MNNKCELVYCAMSWSKSRLKTIKKTYIYQEFIKSRKNYFFCYLGKRWEKRNRSIVHFTLSIFFFIKGDTLAFFHSDGYSPFRKLKLINFVKDSAIPNRHILRILFPIPSCPHALEILTLPINTWTSSFVVSIKVR